MKYTKSGQYELTKVGLQTNTRNPISIDLLSSFVDGAVYESIFEQTMSGNITIVDTNNIRQLYGLGNGEQITLEWITTSVEGEPIIVNGVVYDISETARVNDHAGAFTLHFTSPETLNSIKRRAFAGYNATCDNVVKKLYSNIKRELPVKPKRLFTLGTRNIEQIVFSGQPTLTAIQLLSDRAMSSDGTQGYMFYENNAEFMFTTIEDLYMQEPIIEYTYLSQPAFKDVKSTHEESFTSFQDFEYNIPNKYADEVLDGQHASSWGNLSILNKSMSVQYYSAKQNYNADSSLGKAVTAIDLATNSDYSDKLSIRYTHEDMPNKQSLVNNRMKLLKSNTVSINIGVFGASFIKAGDICIANVPSYSSLDFSSESTDTVSGKFLIAEIKHILTAKTYNQRIQLIKDSYEEGIA